MFGQYYLFNDKNKALKIYGPRTRCTKNLSIIESNSTWIPFNVLSWTSQKKETAQFPPAHNSRSNPRTAFRPRVRVRDISLSKKNKEEKNNGVGVVRVRIDCGWEL